MKKKKIRIGNLLFTIRGLFKILIMILSVGIMDNLVIRVLNINSPLILIPLNLFIFYLFISSIKKEVTEIEPTVD